MDQPIGISPVSQQIAFAQRRSLAREIAAWLFLWLPLVVGIVALVVWLLSQTDDELGPFYVFVLFMWAPIGLVVLGTLGLLATYAIRRIYAWSCRRRAMAILSYLENAIRLNFPLDRFLRAAQESETGHTQWSLSALREALARGMSVSRALASAIPEMPFDILGSLYAAESIGQLQPTLGRLMGRETIQSQEFEQEPPPFYRFYIPLMLIGTVGMTCFFMIFILPKFRDIFKDFHTNIPPVTQFLMNTATWVADDYGWTLFIVPLILFLFAVIARAIQRSTQRVRGIDRTRTFFPGIDAIPWYIPLWRRFLRERVMASVFEFLADALRGGLPLPDAINAALRLNMPSAIRHRLSDWHHAMLGGKTPAEAARIADLPELLTGFLERQRSGEGHSAASATPELFDFLASYYRERFSRLAIFLRAAAEPTAVLLMGVIVGLLVYAMFSPLVALLDATSRSFDRGML